MFKISTYVQQSSTHGVGVFTAEPLEAGQVLWEFTDGVDLRLDADVLEAIPQPFQDKLRTYCYLEEESGQYVLCGDNAKFMNHSFSPNCDDVEGPYTIARRDIEAGEELTCDYRLFDLESRRTGLAEWQDPGAGGGESAAGKAGREQTSGDARTS